MDTPAQVEAHLAAQPEPKQAELRQLHTMITTEFPGCRLWFSDGRDETGKVVTNPSIGYGSHTIRHADGSTREVYRIGLGANTKGISVYILGFPDKTHLARTYAAALGTATVTGYLIRFRRLADIDTGVLLAAIRDGMTQAPRASV